MSQLARFSLQVSSIMVVVACFQWNSSADNDP